MSAARHLTSSKSIGRFFHFLHTIFLTLVQRTTAIDYNPVWWVGIRMGSTFLIAFPSDFGRNVFVEN